ncbi:hypothetical protein FPZ12_041820 [Amycolatopsis acidicola]|uniref:Uncharacterized protein n=1 Tax=Amycolatopsis acidicola TaxID=2596893 RepID=A0A5N0UMI7_9PSEU|nr:hypothetical protein [Amycolatopsis acidicola]KAA9150112.1 hypothetical protein FPZ12_041820 [Amycolatopsis acidicola]
MSPFQDLGPLLWPVIVLMWVIVSMRSRAAMYRRWRMHPQPGQRRPGVPGPVAPGASLRTRWSAAKERYAKVAGEYGAYESDPLQVLRLPALADPAVPSTGRFIDTFHEAMALHTDEFPPEQMARQFVQAAGNAVQAWEAAKEAAEKLRASRFTAEERALIAQGIKLLELAEGGSTPAEQEAAFAAARGVLAKLERSAGARLDWRVPRVARQRIERSGKPRLEP